MTHYKLRVDLTDCQFKDVKSIFEKEELKGWCLEQSDENPHTHMYIISTTKQATIRARIRKLGLKSGNSGYSLKQLDIVDTDAYAIEYIAYMMKEKKFKFYLPDFALEDARAHNDKVVEEMKKKKEKKLPMYKQVFKYIQENKDTLSPQAAILKFHVDNEILIRKAILQCYLDTYSIQTAPRSNYHKSDDAHYSYLYSQFIQPK